MVDALENDAANAASLAGIYGDGGQFTSDIVEVTGLDGVLHVLQISYDGDNAVDEVLTKLDQLNPRHAQVVELRFFGGLKMAEVAEALGVAQRTVESDWTFARAWLRQELEGHVA